MMDIEYTIEDLPAAPAALSGHVFAVSKDGITAKITVGQIVAFLTNGAPAALDTWLELVARLEDDADEIAALFAAIALKASTADLTAAVATLNSAIALKQDAEGLAFGQGYLALDGSNLRLSRKNGKLLTINGAHYAIPSAGVALAATGLTPGTAYYIYAYINAGTMTLEASATVPVENSTTGVMQKTGDATRTLVGLWLVVTGPAWSTVAVQGASYFNPIAKTAAGAVATTSTTTSGSLAELSTNARIQYVTFAERGARVEVTGRTGVSVATSESYVSASVDGSGIFPNAITNRIDSTVGSQQVSFFGGYSFASAAGLHTASILTAVSSGTGTFSGTQVQVTISG